MRTLAAAAVLLLIAGCSDGQKSAEPLERPNPNAKVSDKTGQGVLPNGSQVPDRQVPRGEIGPHAVGTKPYPFKQGTASISGRVVLKEQYKPMATIDMTSNDYCAKCNEEPVKFETIITGEGGTLKNAVVYVSKGLETYGFKPPQEPVVFVHEKCQLKPHVGTVMAGQKVLFKNLDQTLHNINAVGYFGFPMPKADEVTERTFDDPGVQHFKCDAHAWESAKCMVLDHPFSAVTDLEGKFEIKGLVPGTYTISFWHEEGEKYAAPDQTVTLKADEQRSDVNAEFTKK